MLRGAATDAVITITAEALSTLPGTEREHILDTVRDVSLVGLHLTPDRSGELARLVVMGEQRAPGTLLSRFRPDV